MGLVMQYLTLTKYLKKEDETLKPKTEGKNQK